VRQVKEAVKECLFVDYRIQLSVKLLLLSFAVKDIEFSAKT